MVGQGSPEANQSLSDTQQDQIWICTEERRPDKPRATNGGPGQHRPGQTHYKETTFFVQVGGNQKHALEQGKCTIPKKQGHGVVCWGGCHQHQNHYSMMGSGCHGLVYRLRMPCRDAIIIPPPKKLPPQQPLKLSVSPPYPTLFTPSLPHLGQAPSKVFCCQLPSLATWPP